MNQGGFSFILIIIAIVSILSFIGGTYYYLFIKQKQSINQPFFSSPQPSSVSNEIINYPSFSISTSANPHVYTLEVDPEEIDHVTWVDTPRIAQLFHQSYPNANNYDFLNIFYGYTPNVIFETAAAIQTFAQSNVRGICKVIVPADPVKYGSSRLLSTQLYNNAVKITGETPIGFVQVAQNDTEQAGSYYANLMLEEISHQWLVGIGYPYRDQGEGYNNSCIMMSSILHNKDSLGHWSFGLISPKGHFGALREAKPWVDNGDGTFSYDPSLSVKPRKFHDFDLYLMGLMDKSEVNGNYFVLVDPLDETRSPDGINTLTNVKAKAKKITIDDIIAIAGEERNPSVKYAQKDFRSAFVILVKKGQKTPENVKNYVNIAANLFPKYWEYATNYRSTMNK